MGRPEVQQRESLSIAEAVLDVFGLGSTPAGKQAVKRGKGAKTASVVAEDAAANGLPEQRKEVLTDAALTKAVVSILDDDEQRFLDLHAAELRCSTADRSLLIVRVFWRRYKALPPALKGLIAIGVLFAVVVGGVHLGFVTWRIMQSGIAMAKLVLLVFG